MPRREPETTTLILAIREDGTLDKRLKELVGAIGKRSSGDNSEVLTAINNLSRKVDQFMATQEERLRAILDKLPAIQNGVDKIQSELETLKANNPDLEDELAGLEAAVGAVHDDVNPPAPGGDTGEGGGAPA